MPRSESVAHQVGRRGGNFLDAVQDLRPSRVCIDDLPKEAGIKASRCALGRLKACSFSRGSGARMYSMPSLAVEAAPRRLQARLCLVIPCQAAVAAPLHAGDEWASLRGGASTTLNSLPPAVCGQLIHFVMAASQHNSGVR